MANKYKDLTVEQILDKDFYLELLDIQNDLDRESDIALARERAKELKKTGPFDKMLKAAKKEKLEIAIEESKDRQNDFSDDEKGDVKFNTGIWHVTDNGVVGYTDQGKLNACPHPIYIDQFSENVQDGTETVRIVWKKNGVWKNMIIEKNLIASFSKIVDALSAKGIVITSESAKAMVKYLADLETVNLNTGNIRHIKSTSKLGWINNEFVPYEGEIEIDSMDNFSGIIDSIGESGDYMTWLKLVKDIRSTERFEPRIYMAAALASVLIEKLGTLSFIVNLWGETGKGKTVALYLATSIYGNPDGEYISNSRSTTTALEVRSDFLNNFPVMIDDLSQMSDKYDGSFSDLVYQLCDGGKSRSNAKLGINKKSKWKCAILTNCERNIIDEHTRAGAINRVIDVEMEEGYIFENGNYVVNVLKENYGFLGKKFIALIRELGQDKIRSIYDKYLTKLKAETQKRNEVKENKQLEPMAAVLTADELLEQNFFKDGIRLDFNRCYELLKSQEDIDENSRTYDELMATVASYSNSNFIVFEESKPKQTPSSSPIYGKLYIKRNDRRVQITTKAFNKWVKEAGNSSSSFIAWARRHGYLLAANKAVNINGSTAKCIELSIPIPDSDDEKSQDGFENLEQFSEHYQAELPFKN